jgi:hypothetical protein
MLRKKYLLQKIYTRLENICFATNIFLSQHILIYLHLVLQVVIYLKLYKLKYIVHLLHSMLNKNINSIKVQKLIKW